MATDSDHIQEKYYISSWCQMILVSFVFFYNKFDLSLIHNRVPRGFIRGKEKVKGRRDEGCPPWGRDWKRFSIPH